MREHPMAVTSSLRVFKMKCWRRVKSGRVDASILVTLIFGKHAFVLIRVSAVRNLMLAGRSLSQDTTISILCMFQWILVAL